MKTLITVSLVLFLTACATMVNVDYQPGTNFAVLKTYQIQEKPVDIPKDPRVNSPFTQQRVIEALNNQLGTKGLKVIKKKPDVIVKYHLGIKRELESDASGLSFGIGSSSSNTSFGFMFGAGSDVATVDNLIITIDLVKPGTDKLLWRGSFEGRLAEGVTPESSTRLINTMVKTILDKYPPK